MFVAFKETVLYFSTYVVCQTVFDGPVDMRREISIYFSNIRRFIRLFRFFASVVITSKVSIAGIVDTGKNSSVINDCLSV